MMEKRLNVQEYYGKILSNTSSLKTNACCTAETPSKIIRDAISNIHIGRKFYYFRYINCRNTKNVLFKKLYVVDVSSKYYGCGIAIPNGSLKGLSVLDLGCGR